MGRKPEKSFLKAILFGFYLLFLYTMLSVLMAICTVLSELISRGLVASPAEQPLSPENQQFHVVASATAVLLCIAACHTGGLWNRYVALSIWVAAASASAWRFYQQRLVVKRLREQSQRKKQSFCQNFGTRWPAAVNNATATRSTAVAPFIVTIHPTMPIVRMEWLL